MSKASIELIKMHFRSFFRQPGSIFWGLMFPVLMAWVLGIAFTQRGATSKTVMVTFSNNVKDTLSGRSFEVPLHEVPAIISFVRSQPQEALAAMRQGRINLYLEKQEDKMIYHFDGDNPDAVNTYLLLEKMFSPPTLIESEVVPVTTGGDRYIDFLVPGLIALGIMNSCMWGISYNLIEYRMKKLLRRMVATPMRKTDFLFSHFMYRICISSIETIMLLIFVYFYFNIALSGSLLAFLIMFISGIICFSGIAVLIASRTQNPQIGNGLINAVILPMTVVSGIFFSYHNFPQVLVEIIRFLPLTLLADNLRAIFIEGAGIPEVIIPALLLSIMGIGCHTLGIRLFKWY